MTTQTIIRTKRLERGWTLNELAEQCANAGSSTAVSNLYRIETGAQIPRPGLRAVLARLLELDINAFGKKAAN